MKMNIVVGWLQEERARGEHNLTNITKTHERMQIEQKSECLDLTKGTEIRKLYLAGWQLTNVILIICCETFI